MLGEIWNVQRTHFEVYGKSECLLEHGMSRQYASTYCHSDALNIKLELYLVQDV